MSYTKQTWSNGPSGRTPVSASRLNHMEDGITSSDGQLGRTVHAAGFGLYFPEAEGAKADGTTNDQPAILKACSAAGTDGYVDLRDGAIYGLGTHLALPSGSEIRGRATLKMLAANTVRAITIQNKTDVTLSGLTIDLNKDETADGGSANLQQGIYVNGICARVNISDVSIINGWHHGISVVAVSGQTITNVLIERCTISNVGGTGINISCVGNIDQTTPSTSFRFTVRDNMITAPGANGIQVVGVSGVSVDDNWLDGHGVSTGHGIVFSTGSSTSLVTDFTCTKNKIRGFPQPRTAWAADTPYTVGQGLVTLSDGSVLQVTTSGTSGATEPVAPGIGNTVTDGTVIWTQVNINIRYGITVSVNCTRFTIADNEIEGCLGGITIDVEDGAALNVLVQVSASLSGNTVNGASAGHGINVNCASHLSITGNTVMGSSLSGLALSQSAFCTVAGNTFDNNGQYGIAIFGVNAGTGGHTIGPNTVNGNGSGPFNNANPPIPCTVSLEVAKPTITGAKGSNAALASLLTALASSGLITDSTTA